MKIVYKFHKHLSSKHITAMFLCLKKDVNREIQDWAHCCIQGGHHVACRNDKVIAYDWYLLIRVREESGNYVP